ncbi:hypothetical protein MRB53_032261 [Persea americana]|uniref:Uncharacterized protein n=1 Tax=Persea americana TaxID=3435 RepID=A0ACC2KRG3_PERAE|nr:hypothetical protein MRB53_032261 [Persea americana]
MSFFFLLAFVYPYLSTSATLESISWGSSLPVERSHDVIVSHDHTFSAGFYGVGDNAFCFAVWFNKSVKFTPVWMANRDQPVNGRGSALSLQKGGNLVLTDAGRLVIWKTDTASSSPVQLRLLDTGNLMILQISTNKMLWQSFSFPTDTLLPLQPFTREMKLIASRSQSNYSSGFYSFFFDNDNIMRLLYNGPSISSIYWPDPGRVSWEAGRTTYNSSRIAMLDLFGHFQSTDDLEFFASDFGVGPKRRLTIGYDGNLGLYSLVKNGTWEISWQAIPETCSIHGLCGPNGICVYEQSQRRCSCPPGFKLKDPADLSLGCMPTFNLSCKPHHSDFITLPKVDFYGYDLNCTERISLQQCMQICLESCSCKAFLYTPEGKCCPKIQLLNGYHSPQHKGKMHIRVPRNSTISHGVETRSDLVVLSCEHKSPTQLGRTYENKHENVPSKYILWFVSIIGGVELICLVMGCWYMYKNKGPGATEKGCGLPDFNISRIRGTRGYMAPEWVLNQPITSKVDVYSYGIVLLEMVTGRSSIGFSIESEGDGKDFRNLVTWVREMTCATNGRPGRIEQIIDPKIDSTYDVGKMEILVKVALQCVEEDKDARPTMTQVVQMLVPHEYDN